jgi:hypothetical protein
VQLSNARHIRSDGYPILQVDVEGRTAYLLFEPAKPTGFADKKVYLGNEFADLVPDLVDGFTSDIRLFSLFDHYARACLSGSFRPGPIEIPV